MAGSAVKNLEVFQKLCGREAFPKVILVTTRWAELKGRPDELNAAEERERELMNSSRYWGTMIQAGSKVMRHDGSRESAETIVSELLKGNQKAMLDIQREMIDQHLPLDATSAGQYIWKEYDDMRRKYEMELQELAESKDEAMKERDKDGLAVIQTQEQEYLAKTSHATKEQQDLSLTFQALEAEKSQEVAARVSQMEQARTANEANKRSEIEFLEQNIAQLRENFERQEREHKAQIARMRREAHAQTAEQRRIMEDQIRARDHLWQSQSVEFQKQLATERAARQALDAKLERNGGDGILQAFKNFLSFGHLEPPRHRHRSRMH